ncbi:MAG: hypothetical protein GEU93_08140 [Propionibacteriales bacterium]|nr:hypothetical protein [Propionibacteriales bacterium]
MSGRTTSPDNAQQARQSRSRRGRGRAALRLGAVAFVSPLMLGFATPPEMVELSESPLDTGVETSGITSGLAVPYGQQVVPTLPWKDTRLAAQGERGRVAPLSGTGVGDIPSAALRAYRNAALVLSKSHPACNLDWTLLAAIGRVESDHGRFAGAVVDRTGVSHPHIIGVPLDGRGSVAAIRDTDGGHLDGDRAWDRAVGPMQFIPSTWDIAGVDGDSDGVRNPHDLDDAALASAVYLCASGGDLSDPADLRRAVYSYNHSMAYVRLVLQLARAYADGDFEIAPTTAELTRIGRLDATPLQLRGADGRSAKQRADQKSRGEQPPQIQGTGPRQPAATKPGPTPPGPTPPTDPPDSPTPTPPPDGGTSPPDDGQSPPDDGGTSPPDDGGSSPPDDGQSPPPDDGQSPPPEDEPAPEPISGVLTREADGSWRLGDWILNLGSPEYMAEPHGDYDSDGTAESVTAELEGLAGQEVDMTATKDDGVATVYTIKGLAYR